MDQYRYLSEVRRETEAFKSLIEHKARMVVPETQDGKSGDVITIAPDAPLPTSTRKGGAGPVRRSKVIVDVREFRSALPSLLHQRGMTLLPVTLEVGDYILSPSICVERKSIPDLISSFSSGRLFQQAENMTRYYKIAVSLPTCPLLVLLAIDTLFSVWIYSLVQSDYSHNTTHSSRFY